MSTDLPEWIREGAKVAIVHRAGREMSVTLTIVERLTATQIVCAGDRRYRRDNLRQVGDHYGSRLLPLTGRDVVNALAQQRLSGVRHEVEVLVRNVGHDVENVLATLDGIEQAVRDARAAIRNPEG